MNRASVFEWHKRFEEGMESVRDDESCGRSKESIDQSWLAKGLGLGLGYYVEVLRESRKRFCRRGQQSSNRVSGISTGTMHHPQLHPCHTLFDQDGHQDSSIISQQFRLCSLWLLVIPQAQRLSLWDNWGDERGCDEGDWHAQTRWLPWSLPEVVGTVHQVHCSRRSLLRSGLEFHECTINKSAHTKKVWKLI